MFFRAATKNPGGKAQVKSKLQGWEKAHEEDYYGLEELLNFERSIEQRGAKVFEFFKNEIDCVQQKFEEFSHSWKVTNDYLKPKKRQTLREINENWTFYREEKQRTAEAEKTKKANGEGKEQKKNGGTTRNSNQDPQQQQQQGPQQQQQQRPEQLQQGPQQQQVPEEPQQPGPPQVQHQGSNPASDVGGNTGENAGRIGSAGSRDDDGKILETANETAACTIEQGNVLCSISTQTMTKLNRSQTI